MRVVWLLGLFVLLAEAVSLESSGSPQQGGGSLRPAEDATVLERAETTTKTRFLANAKFEDTTPMVFRPTTPGRQRIWIGWFDHVQTLSVALMRRKSTSSNSYFHIELYDSCFTSPPIFSTSKYLNPITFLPEKDQWTWVEFPVNKAVEPAQYYWLKMWFSFNEAGTLYADPPYGVVVNYDKFELGQLFEQITARRLVAFPEKKRDVMFMMLGSLSESSLEKRKYAPTTNIACNKTCLPVGTLTKPDMIGVERQDGPGMLMYQLNILVVEDKTSPDWDPVEDQGKVEGLDQPGSFDLHDEAVVKQDVLEMFEGTNGIAHYEPFKSRWNSVNIYMAKVPAAKDFATIKGLDAHDRFAKGMWGCANIDLAVELVTPNPSTGKSMDLGQAFGGFAASVYYPAPESIPLVRLAGHEMGHTFGLAHQWSLPSNTPKKQSAFQLNRVAPGCLEPMGWCTDALTIEDVKTQTIELYKTDPEDWIYKGFKDPEPCWSASAQVDKDACHSAGGCIWRDGLGADSFYGDYKCVAKMIVLINLCKDARTPAIKQGGCYVGPTGNSHMDPLYMNVASPISGYMYMRDDVPDLVQSPNGYNGADGEQLRKLFTCVFDYRCRMEDWADCQQFYAFWGDRDVHPENTKFIEKGLGCHERTLKRR